MAAPPNQKRGLGTLACVIQCDLCNLLIIFGPYITGSIVARKFPSSAGRCVPYAVLMIARPRHSGHYAEVWENMDQWGRMTENVSLREN